MKNDCVFCAIAAGEIPSFKVYEDDLVLAYLDINPFTEGHTLVIPKDHTTGLLDTPAETLKEIVVRGNEAYSDAEIAALSGLILGEDTLKIVFDRPQRAVTRGQAAVLYDGDTVVGGGTIR